MRNIYFRLFFGLVLIAAIAGVALLAYNAGIVRGEALSAAAPAGQTANPTYPVPFFWWSFPFFGFFGVIALFFLIAIVFRAARFMIWGPRYGGYWMHRRYGRWGDRDWSEGVPPMMAEMHRRMHERMSEAEEKNTGDQAAQK